MALTAKDGPFVCAKALVLAALRKLDANRGGEQQDRNVVNAPEHIDFKAWRAVQVGIGRGIDQNSNEGGQGRSREGQKVIPLDDDTADA